MSSKLLLLGILIASVFIGTCTNLTGTNNTIDGSIVIADQYEPDNTMSSAKQIKPDSAPQVRTLKVQDTDWVSFSAIAGKSYKIYTTGSTDTRISVFSYSGSSAIVSGDDSPGSLNALVQFNCTSSGTYYICVSGNNETIAGQYELAIVSSIGPDSYEPDSVAQAARSISTSGYQSRTIRENDVDWVSCYITSGDSVLFSASGNCLTTLSLYDVDTTTRLATSSQTDSISVIRYHITASGYYFVKITAQTPGATGSYRLSMQTNSTGTLVTPDIYENDNTRATAKLISGNSTVQTRSLTIGDTDWVKLPVVEGRQYTLTCSNTSYVSATMFSKDGTVLQGPSYTLSLNSSATDTVYVRVTSSYSTALNYILSLSVMLQPTVPDEFENDNTKAQAKAKYFPKDSLLQDRTLTVVNSVGDTDWVAFPVIAGKQYTIRTIASLSTTVYMYLYNNTSSSYINYTSSTNSSITYSPTTSDTAYLMIYRPNGYTAVSYTLSVQGQFYNDSYEPDSIRTKASLLSSSAQSRILLPADTDWVMYTATPGDSIAIVTTGSTDTKLALFSSSGSTPIMENDDIGNGDKNAMVSWKSVLGGTYYIRVTGKTAAVTGSYSLQALSVLNGTLVAADSLENDNTKLKARIIKDTALTSENHSLTINDTDWVAFPVLVGATYTVTMTSSSSLNYLYVYEFNSRDSLILSKSSYTNTFTYTPLKNDTLYYRITSSSSLTPVQRYTVSMSRILPPNPDAYENDNIRSLAKSIMPDSIQSRTLAMFDTDWVKIPVTAGNNYKITTQALFMHYTYAYLGSSVSYSAYNYGSSNILSITPVANDTLFIQITQYSQSASYMGPYTVKVNQTVYVPVKSVAAATDHSMFLRTDSTLWATGDNSYGQLGDGTTTSRTLPVKVMSGVVAVSCGYEFTMALKSDGTLWAMGYNGYGQLGDGTTTTKTSPVQIMTNVASVSAGYNHTLILKNDGTLWTTGSNTYGQLADGLTTSKYAPTQVLAGVKSAIAGYMVSCIVKADSTLWVAGYNTYGQLGTGTTGTAYTLAQVMTNVATVSAGYYHLLILKNDKTLWTSGYNSYGQLGDGSTTSKSTPVQVATDVVSITAGSYHSLYVKSDNSLWAMGQNSYGQLCSASLSTTYTPVQVTTGVSAIAAPTNSTFTFYIKTNNTVWAAGSNSYGQLGDGTTTSKTTPVQLIF